MALEAHGESVRERIGVEPTGEAFNAIELDPLNPMVNAGAILARDLLGAEPDPSPLTAYGVFAGRELHNRRASAPLRVANQPSQPGDRSAASRGRASGR